MARKLLNNAGAGDGAEVRISGSIYHPTGLFQVEVAGGTTSVLLQGKVSEDAPWVTVASVTDSGLTAVALCPIMRARVPAPVGFGVTGVTAWLHAAS